MAFTAKILSWCFRHLNIVGCSLKRRPTKGGVTGTPGPTLAMPLQLIYCTCLLSVGLLGTLDSLHLNFNKLTTRGMSSPQP